MAFGLTEFNIFKEEKGWVINLVTGKKDEIVLRGTTHYKIQDCAYEAAERLWALLKDNEEKNLTPVRFAQ